MIFHQLWGWAEIADINQDLILLRLPGFAFWIERAELKHRIPRMMPRSKAEAEFLGRLGYAVPNFV